MSAHELELYELLKIKLGGQETKALFEVVDHKFDSKKDELATKLDIEKIKAELAILKWMTGLVIAGILALILKSFFAV